MKRRGTFKDMKDSATVTCHVDADLLDEVEQECYEIAYTSKGSA